MSKLEEDKLAEQAKQDASKALEIVRGELKTPKMKDEPAVPTREQVLAAQAQAIEQIGKEELVNYALKVQQIMGKGKWFDLNKFQQKFKIPRPAAAQVMLAMFALELLAIENRGGKMKYQVDLNLETQIDVVTRTIAKHEKSVVELKAERERLLKIKAEREKQAEDAKKVIDAELKKKGSKVKKTPTVKKPAAKKPTTRKTKK